MKYLGALYPSCATPCGREKNAVPNWGVLLASFWLKERLYLRPSQYNHMMLGNYIIYITYIYIYMMYVITFRRGGWRGAAAGVTPAHCAAQGQHLRDARDDTTLRTSVIRRAAASDVSIFGHLPL